MAPEQQAAKGSVDHRADGTASEGLDRKVGPIVVRSAQCPKHIARFHATAVGRDRPNRHRGDLRGELLAASLRQQPAVDGRSNYGGE